MGKGRNASAHVAIVLAVVALLAAAPARAHRGSTTRVSLAIGGAEGRDASAEPSISRDGSRIAYASLADNLVPDDTNGFEDVFVFDRLSMTTTRVSVSSSNEQANSATYHPQLTADGRYVVFISEATNLVANDTDAVADVYLRDLELGTTTKVSRGFRIIDGIRIQVAANGDSTSAVVFADGERVAFTSGASNLVERDRNNVLDVFLWTRSSEKIERVSVSSSGLEGADYSYIGGVSGDGKQLIFVSEAENLISDDNNNMEDVFARDLVSNTTRRISLSNGGDQLDSISAAFAGGVSHDGRFVAIISSATNVTSDPMPPQQAFASVPSQVYVVDRDADGDGVFDEIGGRTTRLVSKSPESQQQDGSSFRAVISDDGRWVAFDSAASNLTNIQPESLLRDYVGRRMYLADRVQGTLEVASVSSSAADGTGMSEHPSLNSQGNLLVFDSSAPNLVPADTNDARDVFLRDLSNPQADCAGGSYQDGYVSGRLSDAGYALGTVAPATNDASCQLLVPNGL